MADESYPSDLRYHPEHDWVRTEGDEAVFGITWYAQDALGEVVVGEGGVGGHQASSPSPPLGGRRRSSGPVTGLRGTRGRPARP